MEMKLTRYWRILL